MPPVVSICLPTLNARRFLEPRMETILSQTLKDWELIVCDSYSNDGTWEYFQKFKHDPRVKLCQVPREGLYAGWNECLRRVTGEYVYIATADDTCRSVFLEKMVATLEWAKNMGTREWSCREKPDIGMEPRAVHLAICKCDFIDESDHAIIDSDAPFYSFSEWNNVMHIRGGDMELLAHLCLGVSWSSVTSILFKRSLLDSVGLFRTDCGPSGDILWAVKSAIFTDAIWIPDALATWRCYPDQCSREKSIVRSMQILKGLCEMLAGLEGLLPGSWTDKEDWKGDLLWSWRNVYLRGYRLNRFDLQKSPWQFLEGCGKAVSREPMYLLRRLIHGFRWESDAYMRHQDIFKRLLSKYDVRKPIPFSGGCQFNSSKK